MTQRAIVLVAVLLALGSIPAATAEHLSVGVEDGIGLGPQEEPRDGQRSVTGTSLGEEGTDYGRGTSTDCTEYTGDAMEAGQAMSADGFCGMLIYHKDNQGLRVVSAPDQDLRDPIGTFDVIRSHTHDGTLSTCVPYCNAGNGPGPTGQPTGGDTVFNLTHSVGSDLGFTEGQDAAYNASGDDRGQDYGPKAYVPSPRQPIQQNTGLWEMNGWWWPSPESTFIAYLENQDGDHIGQDRLNEIVSDKKEAGVLPGTAAPTICGYTPDFQFTTVGPGAAGLNCEFGFEERDPGPGPTEDSRFDSYDDSCDSPTYVCGANNGPAWYSNDCLCLGLVDPKVPGSDPFGGLSVLAGPEGQTDHIRWHFVVAPHNSKCGGAQEPGFSFDAPQGTTNPYLAHEVDVYTTIGSVDAVQAGQAVPEVFDYLDETAENFTEEVGPGLQDAEENASELITSLPGTPDDIGAARSQAVKEDRLEPNNAEPIGSIDDTSRTQENGELPTDPLQRGLEGVCERLFAQEVPETVDSWVDYLDSEALAVQDVQVDLTYASDERITRRIGLYGNSDQSQDDSNRPGPSLYQTQGKVGFFADTDDDGEYDQLEAGIKYNPQNIRAGGAFPMFWNMWANQTGIDTENGCQLNEQTMPAAMKELGYGVNTGLVQAIYLNETTAFVNPDTGEAVPYLDGHNIYLLMSQAARHQYNQPESQDNTLHAKIDELVSQLSSYAEDKHPDRGQPDVHVPGQDLGIDAAFTNQCSGRTGNFNSGLQFLHDCSMDCAGDTIATMYHFEVEALSGTLEGSAALPTFAPGDEGPYTFGTGPHTWYDVDPFDNDPSRNDDEENPPPHPDEGLLGEGVVQGPVGE